MATYEIEVNFCDDGFALGLELSEGDAPAVERAFRAINEVSEPCQPKLYLTLQE